MKGIYVLYINDNNDFGHAFVHSSNRKFTNLQMQRATTNREALE